MTYPNKVSTVEWELVLCLLQDEYECGARFYTNAYVRYPMILR